MFLVEETPPKGNVPEHSYPNEQTGIIVNEGMFYWKEPEEKHGVMSLVGESSIFLDVFNPPLRRLYREG